MMDVEEQEIHLQLVRLKEIQVGMVEVLVQVYLIKAVVAVVALLRAALM